MIDSLYKEEFLFHYKNQKNNKKIVNKTNTGKDVNTSCGDEVLVELIIKDGVIKDVGYSSSGCIISTGAMSLLSDHIINKNVEDIKLMSEDDFTKLLGIDLTYARKKCALVGFRALKDAIK